MAQIIIFTGSSRTDPRKFKDPDNTVYNSLRAIGAYQIADVLRHHNYSVQVIDNFPLIVNFNFDLVIDILKSHVDRSTLWIGFSSTFFEDEISQTDKIFENSILLNLEQIETIKSVVYERSPKCKFILGGAKSWRRNGSELINYYVEGYADDSVIALTKYLEEKNPFFQFAINHDGSRTISNDRNALNFEFTNFKFKWHASDYIFQQESLPIEIARGCIFKCAYCSYPLNGKKKLDYIKDPEILKEEFTRNYELYGTTDYFYSDDTHNDNPLKLELLYDQVYSKLNFKINFSAYLRLDLLKAHPHTIDLLRDSGLKSCFFGIESLNHAANKTVGKGAKQTVIIDMLENLKYKWPNIFKQAGFIIGLPNDSIDTVKQWMNIVTEDEFPLDTLLINPLHIFKDQGLDGYWFNDIENKPEKYGYSFTSNNDWINNTGMTKKEAWELRNYFYVKLSTCKKKNNISWLTECKVKNSGLTMDQFFLMSPRDIVTHRNKRILSYIQKIIDNPTI
jgi:radical SAM superfamily enzyme YgiQ (UPF0313 family)